MNAVRKQVNGLRPIRQLLPSHRRALANDPAPMPVQMTDDEINQMADWYAALQWGELVATSDSQEWGFQS